MANKRHAVVDQQLKRLRGRSRAIRSTMTRYWAVSWRPGDRTETFIGKHYRPLGTALHMVQHSEVLQGKGDQPSQELIFFKGYRAQQDPQTGEVHIGGPAACCFAYDLAVQMHVGGSKRVLDPKRNSDLAYAGLDLMAARERAATRNYRLPGPPLVPRLYLGYASDTPPMPEDTPAVRRWLVSRMAEHDNDVVTEAALMRMSNEDRLGLIAREWHHVLVQPSQGDNNTGMVLLPYQFSSYPERAGMTFECFSQLLGRDVFNPVRLIIKPEQKLRNPAQQVSQHLKIRVGRPAGDDYTDEEVVRLMKAMREQLGSRSPLVTDDDLMLALDNPGNDIIPSGCKTPVDTFGEEATVALMRELLPRRHALHTADVDLLAAARQPNAALWVAGLPKICVVDAGMQVQKSNLTYNPAELGIPAMHVDLWSVRRHWAVGGSYGAVSTVPA